MDESIPPKMKELCRFCLKKIAGMRQLNSDSLKQTDIPRLFEIVTAIKLEMSEEYSEYMCPICEEQMYNAARIREEFLHVDQFWKKLIIGNSTEHLTEKYPRQNLQIKREDTLENSVTAVEDPIVICSEDVIKCEEDSQGSSDEDGAKAADAADPSLSSDDSEIKLNITQKKLLARKSGNNARKSYDDPTQTFDCDICGTKICTRRLLVKHMGNHRKIIRSTEKVCHICGKTNLRRLKEHIRDHRKANQFKCTHCNKGFSRLRQFRQHQRVHTGERPFICEICAFTFTNAGGLQRHRKLHNGTTEFVNPKYQRQKARTVRLQPTVPITKPPPLIPKDKLICPLCQGAFLTRSSIYQHIKLMHQSHYPDVWKQVLDTTCMVCHQEFPSAAALAMHKIVHAEHECHICKRRFDNILTLQYHVTAHSDKERPYKCDVCGASYITKTYLKQHYRRAHTEDRPHVCAICGRAFIERSDLTSHCKKVHSYARPFQCNECPEAYKTSALLRHHKEKHTGQFRYCCQLCNRSFYSGPLLTKHMREYHPGDADTVTMTQAI